MEFAALSALRQWIHGCVDNIGLSVYVFDFQCFISLIIYIDLDKGSDLEDSSLLPSLKKKLLNR